MKPASQNIGDVLDRFVDRSGLSAPSFGRTEDGWHVLEMGNVYPS